MAGFRCAPVPCVGCGDGLVVLEVVLAVVAELEPVPGVVVLDDVTVDVLLLGVVGELVLVGVPVPVELLPVPEVAVGRDVTTSLEAC